MPPIMRTMNNCENVLERPASAAEMPVRISPTPMISRRLMMSTSLETGSMKSALRAAAAVPIARAACTSVSPRSRLMGWISRPEMLAFMNSTSSVSPKNTTPYQATAGRGQASPLDCARWSTGFAAGWSFIVVGSD